jgi:cell division protein FtsB
MTDTLESKPPRRKKRRLRILWIVLLSPAVLLFVTVALWLWYQMRVQDQIEAELQKISDLGQPVSVADLNADYAVPEGTVDRTADWLEVLTTIIEAEKEPAYWEYLLEGPGQYDTIPPGTPWPGEQVVAKQMRSLEPTFKKLAELAQNTKSVRYPIHLKQDLVEEYGIVLDLRAVPRTLSLRARWHVYHGRSEAALESLLLARQFTDSLEGVSTVTVKLLQIAHYSMMSGTARDLLPHANWSEAQLKRLQEELFISEDPYRFAKRAMPADRVLRRTAFEIPSLYLEDVPSTFSWTRQADELYFLQTFAKQLEANQLPADQARSQLESIREEVEQDSRLHRIRYPLSRELVPHITSLREACDRFSLTERAIAALIACERYRLQTGAWPEQLTDVTPQYLASVPLDPFEGKPLRFEQKYNGVVIYSIGRNLVDDHAVDKFTGDETMYEPDIVLPLMLQEDEELTQRREGAKQ